MNERVFRKQPSETYPIAIDYTNRLPEGLTLSSGTVAALNVQTNLTDNTVLSSTTGTVSGSKLRAKVQAGVNGSDYKITFTATLSDSSILEDDITMQVRAI